MNVLRVLFDFNECLKESVRFPCATVLCTQTGAQHFLWRPVGLPTPMVFFLLFLYKMWYGSPGVFLLERRAGIWRLVLGNANKAKGGRTEKDEGRKRRGTDGSEQTTKQGRGREKNGRERASNKAKRREGENGRPKRALLLSFLLSLLLRHGGGGAARPPPPSWRRCCRRRRRRRRRCSWRRRPTPRWSHKKIHFRVRV